MRVRMEPDGTWIATSKRWQSYGCGATPEEAISALMDAAKRLEEFLRTLPNPVPHLRRVIDNIVADRERGALR